MVVNFFSGKGMQDGFYRSMGKGCRIFTATPVFAYSHIRSMAVYGDVSGAGSRRKNLPAGWYFYTVPLMVKTLTPGLMTRLPVVASRV